MNSHKLVQYSLNRVRKRGNGAILTVLALALGVGMTTALWAQIDGVTATFSRSLGNVGPNDILVSAQGRNLLTNIDVMKLRQAEGVCNIVPISSLSLRVSKLDSPVLIVGISPSYLGSFLNNIKILQGTAYPPMSLPFVLIGNRVAFNDTGDVRYRLGEPVLAQVGDKPTKLTIVGILDFCGKTKMVDPDNTIFASETFVKEQLGANGYTLVIVSIADSGEVDQAAQYIQYVFTNQATVTSVKELVDTQSRLLMHVQLLSLAFSGLAFTAGGFGVFYILSNFTKNRSIDTTAAEDPTSDFKGFSRTYLVEGAIMASFGTAVGAVIGTVLAFMLPPILKTAWSWMLSSSAFPPGFRLDYKPEIGLFGIGLGFIVSMIAALTSSFCAAKVAYTARRPEALRHA